MRLLIAVVEDNAAGKIVDALVAGAIGVTRLATTGGFLRRGNTTLLVGVEDDQVDRALAIMREAYGPRPEPSGPVFVLPVGQTVRV
ncbi:MAG: cyclic-di-AMP receptor [Chloroflexi bacterium]|nr:cyclic-di-AMP receptor [Chloroflexota bacterium]